MEMKVIDISKHNGNIDFAKVKASGIGGVIIRAGYGKSVSQKDQKFEANYKDATAAGLHVGAYWYSYATTAEEAKEEANCFLQCISGKRYSLPVYLDIEEQASQKNAAEIVKAFCETVESGGYFVGVYASKSYFESYVKNAAKPYTLWVAQWGNACTYSGNYDMWQYSSTGSVPGISGNVDLDICYKDFPSIIHKAGLNGFFSDYHNQPDKHDELKELVITLDGKEVYRGFV